MATDFDQLAEAVEDAFGSQVVTLELVTGPDGFDEATGKPIRNRRTVVVEASAGMKQVVPGDGPSGARELMVRRTYTIRFITWAAAAAKAGVPQGRNLQAGDVLREGKATGTYTPPAATVTGVRLIGDGAMVEVDAVANLKA